MIIDNQKTIIRTKLRKLLLAIISVAIIVTFFTTELKSTGIFGLTAKQAAISIAVLYFLYYFYHIIIEPYYIHFSDEGDNLTFRFYSARLENSKKMVVAIPKKDFSHYEINKELINQKQKLTVFQKSDRGIFKYPSICLSALSSKEKNLLISSLNKYVVKQ